MRISDWSSDVCSSDLDLGHAGAEDAKAGVAVGLQVGQRHIAVPADKVLDGEVLPPRQGVIPAFALPHRHHRRQPTEAGGRRVPAETPDVHTAVCRLRAVLEDRHGTPCARTTGRISIHVGLLPCMTVVFVPYSPSIPRIVGTMKGVVGTPGTA